MVVEALLTGARAILDPPLDYDGGDGYGCDDDGAGVDGGGGCVCDHVTVVVQIHAIDGW